MYVSTFQISIFPPYRVCPRGMHIILSHFMIVMFAKFPGQVL